MFLISLDGLGAEAYLQDPAAHELTALQSIARRGVQARGVTPHFPSTTANSHAALYTGAWGDVNGITGNTMPPSPRSDHTVFERVNGYRSDGLRAEPLWVAAARQGVPTVALQMPQAFPFTSVSTGANLKRPPVVVNGYQTRLLSPHTVLRRANVREEPCRGGSGAGGPGKCFQWDAGPLTLHGQLDFRARQPRSMTISVGDGSSSVTARLAPLESGPPRGRALARHFSDGLYVEAAPDVIPAVIYFRLFEVAPDGSDFLLYQTPIHELGLYAPSDSGRDTVRQLLRQAGGFIGNGPGHALARGPFSLGTPMWKGGDGAAERRYLEAAELVTRQAIRHTRWFRSRFQPELFLGYLNFPDEFEHNWKGLSSVDRRYLEFRKWGYAIVNRFVAANAAGLSSADHLIFVSDHGMAAVTQEVAIHSALRQAGLLEIDSQGRLMPDRTRALFLRNCILLNTVGWKNGIVPLADRPKLVEQLTQALRTIRDPATGQPIVTRIYHTSTDAALFGFGGPNGADLCIDYLPGYVGVGAADSPPVRTLTPPIGYHGFAPSRSDMHAILIGIGPKLPKAATWPQIRAIDVAPLIARLLGIGDPMHARGKSPLS